MKKYIDNEGREFEAENYKSACEKLLDKVGLSLEEIKPLHCPNCKKDMYLEEKDHIYQDEKYDKWGCEDCSHIVVLDFRGK